MAFGDDPVWIGKLTLDRQGDALTTTEDPSFKDGL